MRRLAMSGGHGPICCADRWGVGEISTSARQCPRSAGPSATTQGRRKQRRTVLTAISQRLSGPGDERAREGARGAGAEGASVSSRAG
jgi:hypothetical protein